MSNILEELARKCGEANSNSWDLDREIFKACHLPDTWFGSKVISWFGEGPFGCNTEDGFRHLDCINAPNYTASIDAAATLIPDGCYWIIGFGRTRPNEPLGGAYVFRPEEDDAFAEGEASTVALALCAAALRARKQLSDCQRPEETNG